MLYWCAGAVLRVCTGWWLYLPARAAGRIYVAREIYHAPRAHVSRAHVALLLTLLCIHLFQGMSRPLLSSVK